jgi:aminoglycoside phosphotransferase (APT) family kinase protein
LRLSSERCLEIIRLGIQDILVPEILSDQGRDACQVIMRTVDELLMRERAVALGFRELLEDALETGTRLLGVATQRGLVDSAEHQQLEQVRVLLDAWRSAPNFVDVHSAVLAFFERLATLFADAPYAESTAQMVASVAEMQDRLERALLRDAVPPKTALSVDAGVTIPELQVVLGGASPQTIVVDDFERIPGGLSKRTYRFNAKIGGSEGRPLIAREMAGPPHADFDCFLLENEYALLHDLSDLGFRVPTTVAISADKRFYVMERSPGTGRVNMFSGEETVPKSALLDMAAFMGRLHATPASALRRFVAVSANEVVLTETVEQCVRRMLLKWRDYSRRMRRVPSPIEEASFAWLWANVPPNDAPPSILHGDYGPHNCLWDGGRLSAVLDWEGGHFGDPAFDLGYARAEFESLMDWQEFLQHYEAAGGPRMTRERLEYFERFAMYRTLITDNQCVARGEYGDKSDLFILQVDYQYWPAFIANTASSFAAVSMAETETAAG